MLGFSSRIVRRHAPRHGLVPFVDSERGDVLADGHAQGHGRPTRADLEPLATKAEMRWMFGFQAALIVAMAARLFGLV